MARNNSTQTESTEKENEVTTTETVTETVDYAALAASVEDTDLAKIERHSSGGGRPKEDNPFTAKVAEARADGKVKTLTVPAAAETKVTGFLRRAADDAGHGLSLKATANGNVVRLEWQAKDKKAVGNKAVCPVCHNEVVTTAKGEFRTHGPREARCAGSGKPVK